MSKRIILERAGNQFGVAAAVASHEIGVAVRYTKPLEVDSRGVKRTGFQPDAQRFYFCIRLPTDMKPCTLPFPPMLDQQVFDMWQKAFPAVVCRNGQDITETDCVTTHGAVELPDTEPRIVDRIDASKFTIFHSIHIDMDYWSRNPPGMYVYVSPTKAVPIRMDWKTRMLIAYLTIAQQYIFNSVHNRVDTRSQELWLLYNILTAFPESMLMRLEIPAYEACLRKWIHMFHVTILRRLYNVFNTNVLLEFSRKVDLHKIYRKRIYRGKIRLFDLMLLCGLPPVERLCLRHALGGRMAPPANFIPGVNALTYVDPNAIVVMGKHFTQCYAHVPQRPTGRLELVEAEDGRIVVDNYTLDVSESMAVASQALRDMSAPSATRPIAPTLEA